MGKQKVTMPQPTSGLRRTALAIAVWILMAGGAESDVVEGVNDLTGTTSPQELVPPFEGSSTTDLQVVGAPKNHALGRSAGADPVQLQSEEVANGTGEQVTPDTDTPLAPTGKDKNRQLRSELDQMRSKMKATEERHGKEMKATEERHEKEMKATEERHGKEIAKLKTLLYANVQSKPRATNADVNARLLPAARPIHHQDNGEDDEDLSLSDNEHDSTEPFQWHKNGWHCSSISSSRDACQVPLSPELGERKSKGSNQKAKAADAAVENKVRKVKKEEKEAKREAEKKEAKVKKKEARKQVKKEEKKKETKKEAKKAKAAAAVRGLWLRNLNPTAVAGRKPTYPTERRRVDTIWRTVITKSAPNNPHGYSIASTRKTQLTAGHKSGARSCATHSAHR